MPQALIAPPRNILTSEGAVKVVGFAVALGMLLSCGTSPALSATHASDQTLTTGPQKSHPWHLSATAEAGRNSNVILLDDATQLPQGISDRVSYFGSVEADVSYDILTTDQSSLSAVYNLSASFFNEVSELDQVTHVVSADYKQEFDDSRLMAAATVAGELATIDGADFRNRVTFRPALAYRVADWTVLEGTYTFLLDAYGHSTPNPSQNRDGSIHVLAAAGYFYPRHTQMELKAGGLISSTSTEGSDFDASGWGLMLGVQHPLPCKIMGSLEYSRVSDRAKQVNSLPDAGGNPAKAEADRDIIGISLQRGLGEHVAMSLNYSYSRNAANIPRYSYRQDVWSAGITYDF